MEDELQDLLDESNEPDFFESVAPGLAVEDIPQKFLGSSGGWTFDCTVSLGSSSWRPAAVRNGSPRKAILYVHAESELYSYVEKRLLAAHEASFEVIVALTLESLYDARLIHCLARVDASVFVINDLSYTSRKSRHFMAALADLGVPVSPDVRSSISHTVWSKMRVGTQNQKGKRLEALLAFVFGQVADLRVQRRNYRNRTQEIDIVLQIDNYSSRVWHESGKPFILVEAKNTSDTTGSAIVGGFIFKVESKRQSCKIGIVVSVNGFSPEAKLETLRISRSSTTIALIDGAELQDLYKAPDLDNHLQSLISDAMLN